MLPLVEFPPIVQHYAPWFEPVFSPEALVQFQRYLSGLLISENKTVEGINRPVHGHEPAVSQLPQAAAVGDLDDQVADLGMGEARCTGSHGESGTYVPEGAA